MPSCRGFVDRKSGNAFEQGHCVGIVEGILYMGVNLTEFKFSNDPLPLWANLRCVDMPNGVTGAQAVRVVIAYIDARPARTHEKFRELALEALRTAWPCR
jgi:Rap1a immunity proteins